MARVIFVTKDGKERRIKLKIARFLESAGKGQIKQERDFVAPKIKQSDAVGPADLFKSESYEDETEKGEDGERPLVSDSVKEFAESEGVDLAKVQGTGRLGRVIRADVQAYKTRMLSANPAGQHDEQRYQTTDLKAD